MVSSKNLRNTILLGLLVLPLLLLLRISFPIRASSPTLLISEVEYDSIQSGTDSAYEWLELYNNTSSPMELTNWTISDNVSTDVISPTVTIPVGGCLVIAASEGFYTNYPSFTGAIVFIADGKIGNGLGNTGDRLVLKDSEGMVIDQMSYGTDTTAFDPACPGVKEGHSLERSPANVDTDTAADWIDQEFPNPGSVTVPTPTPTDTPEPTATPTTTPTPTVTMHRVYLPLVLKQFDVM
jgi:hypothetical protein